MNMTLNRLPSITWYWLKMNNGSLEDVDPANGLAIEAAVPEGVEESVLSMQDLPQQPTGMGKDMTELVTRSVPQAAAYISGRDREIKDPVLLSFPYKAKDRAVNAVFLKAQRGSAVTVVEDFASEKDAEGFAAVQTRYQVEQGATLKIIQIQRLGSGFTFLNDIGGRVENDGRIELVHLVLDGGHTYLGVQNDLAGFRASLKADIGYRVKDQGTLDINYFANHTGKKTTCDIDVKGVLRDNAKKIFRGTIDLKKGSSGSVGNEKEDVLMMDDTVRSQTLPVILCTEEDVVGNHGATIGRLDENTLFYLQSRGMDRESVYEMMADAKVASVVHLIDSPAVRRKVEDYLTQGMTGTLED